MRVVSQHSREVADHFFLDIGNQIIVPWSLWAKLLVIYDYSSLDPKYIKSFHRRPDERELNKWSGISYSDCKQKNMITIYFLIQNIIKLKRSAKYDPILINNNTYQDSSILCKYYYMYVYNSDIMLCCGPIVPGRISVVPLTAEERSCDEKCVKSQWPEWNPTTQQWLWSSPTSSHLGIVRQQISACTRWLGPSVAESNKSNDYSCI